MGRCKLKVNIKTLMMIDSLELTGEDKVTVLPLIPRSFAQSKTLFVALRVTF